MESCCIKSTSGKPVGIEIGKNIITTLNIEKYDQLISFLQHLGIIKGKVEEPLWVKSILMFDDSSLRTTIVENEEIIKKANTIIEDAKKKLVVNSRYKSILYSNGRYMEDVVKEILSEMLNLDFSSFVDEKHEDFFAEKEGWYIIGEIKGVNHNIKNVNISQLDLHYQSFVEEHSEIDKERITAVLIMNYHNSKPLEERQKVNDEQIRIAERNGSLIIDAYVLLKMFEKYKTGQLSSRQCFELIRNKTGILYESDLI